MSYFAELRAHKDSFLKGLTYLVAGFALVLAGTIIGFVDNKWVDVLAGSLAVTGIVMAFLGFFVHVIPPLLPAK